MTVKHSAEAAAAVGMPEAGISPLLPPPAKMFGFTYISVFVEKFSLPPTMGRARKSGTMMSRPLLTMSVYGHKGQLMEVSQVK